MEQLKRFTSPPRLLQINKESKHSRKSSENLEAQLKQGRWLGGKNRLIRRARKERRAGTWRESPGFLHWFDSESVVLLVAVERRVPSARHSLLPTPRPWLSCGKLVRQLVYCLWLYSISALLRCSDHVVNFVCFSEKILLSRRFTLTSSPSSEVDGSFPIWNVSTSQYFVVFSAPVEVASAFMIKFVSSSL